MSIAQSEPEKTIFSFFVAVTRVIESNPRLAIKQASFHSVDVILSVIEVDGFGELRRCARIIVWAVIDFVVFQSSTRRKYVRPAWMFPARRSIRFYLECTKKYFFLWNVLVCCADTTRIMFFFLLFSTGLGRRRVKWSRTDTNANGSITLRATCATSWSSLMVAGVTTRGGISGTRFEGGWAIGNPWTRSVRPGKGTAFLEFIAACSLLFCFLLRYNCRLLSFA